MVKKYLSKCKDTKKRFLNKFDIDLLNKFNKGNQLELPYSKELTEYFDMEDLPQENEQLTIIGFEESLNKSEINVEKTSYSKQINKPIRKYPAMVEPFKPKNQKL